MSKFKSRIVDTLLAKYINGAKKIGIEGSKEIRHKVRDYAFDGDEIPLPHVVSFSGGRTSGLMLRILQEAGLLPIVLFANTGKERDETLDFVHEVEIKWDIPVVWLEYCRIPTDPVKVGMLKTKRMQDIALTKDKMHWFKTVDYDTASRHSDDWGPFDEVLDWSTVLPNSRSRFCTAELKIRTMLRYLWSVGIYRFTNHIGIRSDEWDRAVDLVRGHGRSTDVYYQFPLGQLGLVENDVFDFWNRQEFDLQLRSYEGNCHLCFLKKLGARQQLIREHPDKVSWWSEWEKRKQRTMKYEGKGSSFDSRYTLDDLEKKSKRIVLGSNGDVSWEGSAMECSCTSGNGLGSDFMDDELEAEIVKFTKPQRKATTDKGMF